MEVSMSDRFVRWGGIAAIVFVVLILFTAFSAGSPPSPDDAIDKVRQFYSDHRGILLVSNMVALFAIPFVVWWAIVFREVVHGDASANALGTGVLAGVLITAAAAIGGGALNVSVVYLDKGLANIPDGVLRVVFEGQGLMFQATSAGLVLMALTAGLSIQRTGALPGYTMWLAFIAVVGNLVAMASTLDAKVGTISFAGLLSFTLFLLVTGIVMAAGKATPAATATA
jgi:hypothetical protein